MLTPPIKIEDKDNFLQEVQRLNNIYIYMVLIEENGKKKS